MMIHKYKLYSTYQLITGINCRQSIQAPLKQLFYAGTCTINLLLYMARHVSLNL